MSQNKFVLLPVLSLKRSKTFLSLIISLHLISLISVMYSVYFHLSINISLCFLIIFSFYYYILYYQNVSSIKMIKYRADGMWILGYEKKPILVSIESEYMITEWFIILRFKIGQSQKRTIPIFKDMLSVESFKQLRVVLPYILRERK